MESRDEKKEAFSIIFANMDVRKANFKLDIAQARSKPTKSVWLLRESSVDGLLTVSYFDKQKNLYQHTRIGLVDGEWKIAPADKGKAVEFREKAELSFAQTIQDSSSVDKLFIFLERNNFNQQNILKPIESEASKKTGYSSYSLEEDSESSGKRYGMF